MKRKQPPFAFVLTTQQPLRAVVCGWGAGIRTPIN